MVTVLSGCGTPRTLSTGTTAVRPTTSTGSSTTNTAGASSTTIPTPGTIVPPSTVPPTTVPPTTSLPASEYVALHWLNVSFAAPKGWAVSVPVHGNPQYGCVHPAIASPDGPSWSGCSGIWVIPWSSDPAEPSPGSATAGQVWFMSTGVRACPYTGSNPGEVVLNPGTLVNHADRVVGGITYQWYEWSATCNLNGSPGAPVTHTFDAQVWWLPSSGIAFTNVADHPEITEILDTVHRYVPPPTTTTTKIPTTTTTTPETNIQIHSPTGNIHCGIHAGLAPSSNFVHCFTEVPPQSVTLSPNGTFSTCAGATCLATPNPAEVDLLYGQAAKGGPFSCTSTFNGMICTVNGKGFEISRSGVANA